MRRRLTPQQRYQAIHRARGLCILCPRKAAVRDGRRMAHCQRHLEYHRQRIQQRRAER